MIRRCPNCTERVPLQRRLLGPEWECGRCGSRLARYIPDGAPFILSVTGSTAALSVVAVLWWPYRGNALGDAFALAVALLFFAQVAIILYITQTCRVVEPGQAWCGRCGYDMRAVRSRQCPECGQTRKTS